MTIHSPRTTDLLAQRAALIPRGIGGTHPIIADRAAGARLWDIDGNEYIDFAGGIGVLNIGNAHPRVVAAVAAQLERFTHTCFQVTMYEPYLQLAARLNALMPGDFAKKSAFFTTGVEATENAVKIARAATGRPAIIAFANSFHGRTLLGMTLTGKAKPYKQNFGPFAPEIYHAPFPYEYRGWSVDRALAGLHELFETIVAPERVAAVIIEPVQGEGGFIPAPASFLRELRAITAKHGILLIDDEIQTGFGRTAKLFAIEHSGVVPDMLAVAKSLAGGLPLSGVVGRAEVMDGPLPGGLGGTYAGNPLSCVAALAVLDAFAEDDVLGHAERLATKLWHGCHALAERHSCIGDVRGLGAMLALELVHDQQTRTPAADLADRVLHSAREHGLLLLKAGLYGNVIRMHVPLLIDDEELARAFAALEAAFAAAA